MKIRGIGLACVVASLAWTTGVVTSSRASGPDDVIIGLVARDGTVQVRPGARTSVLTYEPHVISAPSGAITTLEDSWLGPIIRIRRGATFIATLSNTLDEETTVHWHGLDVPAQMDGHPMHAVEPGHSRTYAFRVENRAGTYWFHPHPHMMTATQVYRGLAGMFIVEDDEEQALPLPRGDYDVPLIIQDRVFNASNEMVYQPSGMAGMFGDQIVVNGRPNAVHRCATRVYRLRFLNGSNSRIYKLGWSDEAPMTVIGTDGGLLRAPVTVPYVMLAPGERVEVWADWRGKEVGESVMLQSLAFSGAGPVGNPTLPHGSAFDIMRFDMAYLDSDTLVLPQTLSTIDPLPSSQSPNWNNPRTFALTMQMGQFLINGRTFEMMAVAPEEIVRSGEIDTWRLTNTGTMGLMPHPMHLHGRQFQIQSRTILPSQASNWETVRYGYVDEGWKDTLLLMPGESVTFLVKHGPHLGLFMYHCHNLEHEDMGMMRNFRIDP